MSGHSKWSTIKRQKGVTDQRRGALFSKLSRELAIAARQGGADPQMNVRLRLIIQKARDVNMPVDNITRAIQRGAGGAEGGNLAELTLEGYGPGGVAIMVAALSDNRNRTIQEVRNLLSRHGGSLAESGAVAWLFESRGVIAVETPSPDETALEAIDAGAEDVKTEKAFIEVYTRPQDLERVRRALEAKNLKVTSADISLVPRSTIMVDERTAIQNLKLLDSLEEMEDVRYVNTNLDYSEAVLEKLRVSGLV
jgi:YebC/PmpR family DNA-binding regulatory protein